MPVTLKQQMEKLLDLKQRRAAFEGVIRYVSSEFVSKDGRKATKAIRCPDVPPGMVPDEKVEDVLAYLNDGLKTIDIEIASLEALFVEDKKDKKS